MKKILTVLLALFMLALCVACSKPDESVIASYTLPSGEVTEVEMKLASNTDIVQYLLYVPSDWTVKDRSASTVAYVSEQNKSSVSVAQWNLTSEYTTIDAWWALALDEYTNTMPDFALVGEQGIARTLDGAEAKEYNYTARFSGVTYKYCVIASIDQGSIHVITYTSTEELFNEAYPIFNEAILGAFKFD